MSEGSNDIAFSFPLFYWSLTCRPNNPFISISGPGGQQTTPFFSSDVAAIRYLGLRHKPPHYNATTVFDRSAFLTVLSALEAGGFTHVTLNTPADPDRLVPVAELRQLLESSR